MEEDQTFEDFDPQIQEDVEGLIHLGAISKDFEFCGHAFGLRTLRIAEDLAASKVVEDFRNTLGEPQAWQAAQVALALTHVDGDDAFCPQAGPDQTAFARARFNYVTTHWYQPTIDFLWDSFTELLERQVVALEAVRNLSPGSLPSFMPLDDSFNPQDISADEILSRLQSSPR